LRISLNTQAYDVVVKKSYSHCWVKNV